ncbi:hypothetical protein HHX47_DHR3000361 [Lentinula edodes]|nr:hypothetical protein HHX47_DHR3000361 [Lentinula edodes]
MFIDAVQSNISSNSGRTNSIASTQAPNCKCDALAGRRAVVKDGPNQGRPFWTCEEKACDYFAWADDSMPPSKPMSTVPTKRTFSNRMKIKDGCSGAVQKKAKVAVSFGNGMENLVPLVREETKLRESVSRYGLSL